MQRVAWVPQRLLSYLLLSYLRRRKIINASNLLCGLNIVSPSLQMTNRPELGVVIVT